MGGGDDGGGPGLNRGVGLGLSASGLRVGSRVGSGRRRVRWDDTGGCLDGLGGAGRKR